MLPNIQLFGLWWRWPWLNPSKNVSLALLRIHDGRGNGRKTSSVRHLLRNGDARFVLAPEHCSNYVYDDLPIKFAVYHRPTSNQIY